MEIVKLILLALSLLALPVVGRAQFTFTTNNAAITITGYTGPGGTVIIPSTTNGYKVIYIGSSAFLGCTSVTNISIPSTVTNIEDQAFTESGLAGIVIPDSVTNIGRSAFLNCLSLANVTIGNKVISLGDDAFYGCSSLASVSIPQRLTNIYSTAFIHCTNLIAINVDAANPAYSSVAGVLFDKHQTKLVDYPCGLGGSYTIPGTVTSIGDYACHWDSVLTNVIIPQSVTTIGAEAFSAASLTNVTIPTNVTTIGQDAFGGIGATNIIIPASVTNIGTAAFYSFSLRAITVATNNPAYSSVAGVLFDISQTTLVEFPLGKSGSVFKPGSYIIPNGVTRIGDAAFEGSYLGSITIPSSVTTIGNAAFEGCGQLMGLTIPNSVTNIGNGAFAATDLTNIIIPASVTTLGWFGDCSSLRSVYFEGNAPGQGNGIPLLSFLKNATAYYLPSTTGWAGYFQVPSLSTALWLPQTQAGDGEFGVRTNRFGFNINWASGQTLVVEACTNLSNPVWQPVQTNTLISGMAYFSDPWWTNYLRRYYRLRSP
jgi:hypothetical protein